MDSSSLSATSAHLAEDELEEYSFDRLPVDRLAAVEEHLNRCVPCRETLEQVEEFILVAQVALAEYEANSLRYEIIARFRAVSRSGWAGSIAVLCLAGLIAWRVGFNNRPAPLEQARLPQTISLLAQRGGNALGISHAPHGKPLRLKIDLTGLPAKGAYRIQMVNWEGAPVWEATVVQPLLAPRLGAGIYWIRLYSGAALLREFGLRLD